MPSHWTRRAAIPLAVSALLVAVGLVARLVGLQLLEPDVPAPLALRLLDVNRERNLPTAWSVGLLLAGAWSAARLARQHVRAWWLLVAVLLVMAADEGVQVHERADALGRVLAGDALHFAWVVPGALAAGAVGLLLLRGLRTVPVRVRRRLVVAGVPYLSGALLVEALSGTVLDTVGRGVLYALLNAVEEGLEMTGACLLLAALLSAREPVPEGVTPGGVPALVAHD